MAPRTRAAKPRALVVVFSDELLAADPKWWHMCGSVPEARAYVEGLHDKGWDERRGRFKKGRGFQEAVIYRALADGRLKQIDSYHTMADETGNAIGWTGV